MYCVNHVLGYDGGAKLYSMIVELMFSILLSC